MIARDRSNDDQRPEPSGFTLIELLVVIVLIGIVVGMALLSINLISNDRNLQRQLLRLSAIIEVVSDEAQMQGRDFGLEFMQGGYRFIEYDPFLDVWNEVAGDDLMQPTQIDEGMEFELHLEERRVLLHAEVKETQSDPDKRDLTDDYLPHVLIMSSGDITPFRLQLIRQTDNLTLGLNLKPNGETEILSDDQPL